MSRVSTTTEPGTSQPFRPHRITFHGVAGEGATEPEAKRAALANLLAVMAAEVADTEFGNPWHIDELAGDAVALATKIRMAGLQ